MPISHRIKPAVLTGTIKLKAPGPIVPSSLISSDFPNFLTFCCFLNNPGMCLPYSLCVFELFPPSQISTWFTPYIL